METAKPILFIGAADGICRESVRLFAKATNVPLLLADADEDAVRRLATSLSRKNVFTKKLDLFDAGELRTSIADVALVVQGAQPYYRTSTHVLRACIESKTPYLDFSDDVSSTQESLDLQDEAKKAGVPCYNNCGSSPGITNLMAVQICSELDDVQRIDICWLVSEEGGALGREVLEHLMHITGGPCLSWADGHAVVHENWVEKDYAPIKPDVNVLFHESVHPEPVTLPRRFPQVNRIRTMGALNPVPYNGFARGLGAAVHAGTLSMEDAVDFLINLQKGSAISWSEAFGAFTAQLRGGDITLNQLVQLASHGVSTLKPWNHAIWGMIKQVRNGECRIADVVKFLVNSTLGKRHPINPAC
ncbi:hypothetical protein FOVSG1_003224 [Fusarium oxysporum f. sp. vasinfectum]